MIITLVKKNTEKKGQKRIRMRALGRTGSELFQIAKTYQRTRIRQPGGHYLN